MPPRPLLAMAACACILPLFAGPAVPQAKTPVNIELLLALDASASVNRAEFALQMRGISAAFSSPEVLKAIENLKPLGVAVGISQWGGPGESRLLIDFTHIETAQDSKAFGFVVGRSFRFIGATTTSISTAITDGVSLLERNAFEGQRIVIDVSGDGKQNSGESLDDARAVANAKGITVNGLAIEADEAELTEYYRQNVIVGSEAFVETANDFEDFARAIEAKLVRELRPLGS